MSVIDTIFGFVRQHEAVVLICLCGVVLLLLVLLILQSRRMRKLGRLALGAVGGDAGLALRQELIEQAKSLSSVSSRLEAVQNEQNRLKSQQELAVQRIGFVRFDAFDDVGGEQSFSLALLDSNRNGVVLSNVFSRADSRVYAKPIRAGASETTLSTEEKAAVEKAEPGRA